MLRNRHNYVHAAFRRTFGLLISVFFLLPLWAQPLAAEVRGIVVEVDGLACPFCAYGLEKHLKKLDAVDSLDIRLKKGEVALKARSGRSLSLAEVRQAIVDAGFTWGKGAVTVAGNVQREGANWRLKADTGQSFVFAAAGSPVTAAAATALLQGTFGADDLGKPVLTLQSVQKAGTATGAISTGAMGNE